jgi:hypothetical protein
MRDAMFQVAVRACGDGKFTFQIFNAIRRAENLLRRHSKL